MTAKQIFLNRIKDKLDASQREVKTYSELYTQNEKLPDSFFEGLIDIQSSPNTPLAAYIPQQTEVNHDGEVADYGRNKRVVVEILNKEGKAMLKSDIIKMFEQITGEENATTIVTNAMAALSSVDKAIIGFKIKGVKVRGNFWALSTWMDRDEIMPQYSPKPVSSINKFLSNDYSMKA